MLKALRHVFRCGNAASLAKDSPDSTPLASALCSMHTGQNSTAPENSFPQLEQTRLAFVFMP